MVEFKKILKELEELESFKEKIKYLRKIYENIDDENEKKEFIEFLKELFPPEEEEESLEQIITQREEFSKPTLPFKPVLETPRSLETIVPQTTRKEEDLNLKEQIYTPQKDIYGKDIKDAYRVTTDEYKHDEPVKEGNFEPRTSYKLMEKEDEKFKHQRFKKDEDRI